eukprot:g12882.t1
MSGSASKQEQCSSNCSSNCSSSSRSGAERSSGYWRPSSGAADGRGRGGGRGRGRGRGGRDGQQHHHKPHYHRNMQWVPPKSSSDWRPRDGGGFHYDSHESSGSNSAYNSRRGGGGSSFYPSGGVCDGGSASSTRVVPGSSLTSGNSDRHNQNDYTRRYRPGGAQPQPPPPPPPPPRPPPTAAPDTLPYGSTGNRSKSAAPPSSAASPQSGHGGDGSSGRRRRRSDSPGTGETGGGGGGGSTGRGSAAAGNGDEAGGDSGRSSNNNSAKKARKDGKPRKSRQSQRQSQNEKGNAGDNDTEAGETRTSSPTSVVARRQAKLKELKMLGKRKKAAVAAGEALAKEVEKNRMEQDEIAIQIDAANRLLALYDSNSSSGGADPDVSILPTPRSRGASKMPAAAAASATDTSAAPSPGAAAASSSRPPPPLSASSFSSSSSSSSSFGTVRGRGGGSAATRGGRASGSSRSSRDAGGGDNGDNGGSSNGRSSSSTSTKAAQTTTTTTSNRTGKGPASRRKGGERERSNSRRSNSNSSFSSSSSSDDEDDYPPGGRREELAGGAVGGQVFGLITSMPPSGGGSSKNNGGGSSSSSGREVVGTAARNPPASVDAADDFPARVPSDGSGTAAGEGVEAAAAGSDRRGDSSGGGSASGVRGTTGVHRGVEVNGGSFNIVKQLMFKTSRSHRSRSMAFNPVEPALFAVCSGDLSVDLWRCGRNHQELERVSERSDVTPSIGAHMAWNPLGTHLAIGHSGSILVDNWAATVIAKDGKKHADMKLRSDRHNKPASAVAWVTPSKNNQDHLVTGGEDGHVVIWTRVLDAKSDLHKVAILHSRHTSAVKSACCPSISPTVVTGGADGRLVSYSIETASVQWEELLRVSKTYHPMVNELLEFPDNPHSLLVSAVDTAKSHSMFTMDTRQPTALIHTARRMEWKRKDEKKPFSSLVYPSISPCGRYVTCAGDWNGCFHIWDVRSSRSEPMQSVLVNSEARVMYTAWHPDQSSRALMSLSAANGHSGKNFALHLHAGLRP